jgi:hypothetical protein
MFAASYFEGTTLQTLEKFYIFMARNPDGVFSDMTL